MHTYRQPQPQLHSHRCAPAHTGGSKQKEETGTWRDLVEAKGKRFTPIGIPVKGREGLPGQRSVQAALAI